jgi:hypothetical protein
MTADPLEPLRRWRDDVSAAPIPASARLFAPELYDELVVAARSDEPPLEDLRADLKDASGTGRRSRCLRILDRLGLVDRAVAAVSEVRATRTG